MKLNFNKGKWWVVPKRPTFSGYAWKKAYIKPKGQWKNEASQGIFRGIEIFSIFYLVGFLTY
jgi:hypothetical protein